MKKILFCILFAAGCFIKVNAQYAIEYTYDNAGNREHRKIIPLSSQVPSPDELIPPVIDQLGDRKIEVFPNPTKGSLLVRIIGGNSEETYSYSVTNFSGIKVCNGNWVGNGDFPIELGKFANGIYILVLKEGKDKLTYKIIKE